MWKYEYTGVSEEKIESTYVKTQCRNPQWLTAGVGTNLSALTTLSISCQSIPSETVGRSLETPSNDTRVPYTCKVSPGGYVIAQIGQPEEFKHQQCLVVSILQLIR